MSGFRNGNPLPTDAQARKQIPVATGCTDEPVTQFKAKNL
jgi:hypothetical protein